MLQNFARLIKSLWNFFLSNFRSRISKVARAVQNDVYYALPAATPQLNITQLSNLESWHCRLGHPAFPVLRSILNFNDLASSVHVYKITCNSCYCNKSQKLSFGVSSMTSSKPLQLIYTDFWGPAIELLDQSQYYILFVDHCTKYIWLYLMKKKVRC